MPIRFQCDGCHQRLSIARRKAGAQIVCPTCGQTQTVPSENGDSGLIDSLIEKDSSSSGEIRPDLGAESLPDEAAIPVPPLLPAVKKTIDTAPSIRLVPKEPATADRDSASTAATATRLAAAVALGGLLPGVDPGGRRHWRVCRGLLPGPAGRLGVASPTLPRRGRAATAPRDGFRDEEVLLQGRMLWMPTFGQAAGDGQSVLLLLPRDKTAGQSLPIKGLRPTDEPAEDESSSQQIKSLGGIYARAAADGTVAAVLPREGRYYLLLISRNTLRPKEQSIRAKDLAEMKQYFAEAERLVGDQKYVWKETEVRVGHPPIEYDFGLDGLP